MMVKASHEAHRNFLCSYSLIIPNDHHAAQNPSPYLFIVSILNDGITTKTMSSLSAVYLGDGF